ncbi:AcrB/AcrD/AcrF family protein, partial [Pseudomonas syringae pv. actinidiae ICMP 18804]
MRDSTYLVDLVGRAESDERSSIQTLSNLQIPTPNGSTVPL